MRYLTIIAVSVLPSLADTWTSQYNYYLEGSYSAPSSDVASHSDFSDENLSDLDAINVDQLLSIGAGMRYSTSENVYTSVGIEYFYGSSSSSGINIEDGGVTETGDFTNHGLLANVKLGHNFNSRFSGYIGGGAGVTFFNVETKDVLNGEQVSSFEDDQILFTYQVLLGLEMNFTDYASFFAQYRYLSTQDIDSASVAAIKSSFIDLGMRFYF